MSYTDQAKIEKAISAKTLVQLTDDLKVGSAVTSIIDEVLVDVKALVDGYCGKEFTDPVPKIIASISTDIAVFKLYSRRITGEMPDSISKLYSNAIKTLEAIQSGKIKIGESEPIEDLKIKTNKTASDRMFPKDVLNGF